MRAHIAIGVVVCSVLACAGESSSPPFWDTWGDNKAEVNVYQLTQPRYGQLREGRAVLIYVAQPFLRSTRVKPEGDQHPDSDIFYVLKLNHLRTFETGVYPYRLMTSSFVHVDPEGQRPRGAPTKIVFSSQEWCGATFHELLFDQDAIRSESFSYFDGEADQKQVLKYPKAPLVGDTIFVAVRGLLGELAPRGGTANFPYLPTLTEVRLQHEPLAWSEATVTRAEAPQRVTVPAGELLVDAYTITSPGRAELTIHVEAEHPHRIIRWETSDGERGELLGSERMQYWKLNDNGDESALSGLGLP